VIVAATTVVLVVSVLLGLRYWGVLLAVATTTYQFSSVYGLSFGISVALNTLPVIYLLPRLLLRRRYGFTIVDFFLLVWIGGYFINFARSYSMDVPLEIFLRTLFFCGCYFMLGRLLVMDDDRGKRYLCEYAPAVILLTLFFALIAQDTSQQELASQIQFDMDAGMEELAGRLAVGEGNPVGYSAAVNTAASTAIGILCAAIFARGVLPLRVTALAAVASVLMCIVALEAGTRGLIVALFGIGALIYLLAAMRNRTLSNRITICLLAGGILIPAYFALPSLLTSLAEVVADQFGGEYGNVLRQLALMLSDSEALLRDQSTAGRLEFWYVGWKLIQDSPLLGTPTDYLMQNRFWAHNFFLEQWVAAGLLGLVGAIVFVGSTFRAALRLIDVEDSGIFVVAICSTAIFVSFLIQAQFSFSTFHGKMMFLAAGMIIGLDRALRRERVPIGMRRAPLPGPVAAE